MRVSIFMCSLLALVCLVIVGVGANRAIEWKRRLNTCDAADRAFIEGDTTRFIYAYNDDSNVADDDDVFYHGPTRRGSKSVKLFSPPIDEQIAEWEKTKPSDTYPFDLLVHNSNKPVPFDSNVTGPTTTYWCNAFKLPDLADSQYIIRYEAVVPPAVFPYMHHVLVYECDTIADNLEWLNYEGHCYDTTGYNPIPSGLHQCNGASVVGAWAVGGEPYLYPSFLGMPFAGQTGTKYVLVESHWNNPAGASIVIDQAGMRFYATKQTPQYEAGMLEFGHTTNGAFSIPPKQQDYAIESWMPAQCTQFLFNSTNTGTLVSPNGGVRFVANFLHAHTTGAKIQFHRVTLDGVEEVIVEDNSYDFNFQTTNPFAREIAIYPGESLKAICHYNTMSRTAPTTFGLSTQQEMCLTYTLYYPRLLNTKAASSFANYTQIGQPDKGSVASCGNQMNPSQGIKVTGDANILPKISQPYAPPNCDYNPPPSPETQGPKGALSIDAFDPDRFPNHLALDQNNLILLHYEIDNVTDIIHLAVEFPVSQGWMGLGYGGNGGMAGSDINLGWIDNVSGAVMLTDRLATQEGYPGIDQYNDLYDIVAYNSTKSDRQWQPPAPKLSMNMFHHRRRV